MYEKIQETASWLRERMTTSPKTAIILGTGLGQLASEITAVSYTHLDVYKRQMLGLKACASLHASSFM